MLAVVALAEEFDEALHVWVDAVAGVEFSKHGGEGLLAGVEELTGGGFEGFDVGFVKAGAEQSGGINPRTPSESATLTKGVGIAVDLCVAGDVSAFADGDEVVNADAAHDGDVVADDDVPGEHDVVGDDAAAADLCVVPMWALIIRRFWLLTRVIPPPVSVPMWIVTASRMTLPLPMSSFIDPPRYFRS